MSNNISKKIKELREQNNITQNKLANDLFIKQQTVAQWENGSRALKADSIISLAKYFNVSTDYLLGLTENTSTNISEIGISNKTGFSTLTVENILNLSAEHKIILDKIIDEANIATKMLSDIKQEDFVSDDILKRAAAMSVINIGELVKNLTFEFRNEYKSVPWKAISGFRDVAAHKYGTLDMNIVYNTVKIDIPMLKENIQQILKTADVKFTE